MDANNQSSTLHMLCAGCCKSFTGGAGHRQTREAYNRPARHVAEQRSCCRMVVVMRNIALHQNFFWHYMFCLRQTMFWGNSVDNLSLSWEFGCKCFNLQGHSGSFFPQHVALCTSMANCCTAAKLHENHNEVSSPVDGSFCREYHVYGRSTLTPFLICRCCLTNISSMLTALKFLCLGWRFLSECFVVF